MQLTNPFNGTARWQYRDNGWLDRQVLGNRVATSYEYDDLGQLTRLSHRDPKGHLLSRFTGMT